MCVMCVMQEKSVTVGEQRAPVPVIGAPIMSDDKMLDRKTKIGRIRKKRKKDLERARKIRQRMAERGVMSDL